MSKYQSKANFQFAPNAVGEEPILKNVNMLPNVNSAEVDQRVNIAETAHYLKRRADGNVNSAEKLLIIIQWIVRIMFRQENVNSAEVKVYIKKVVRIIFHLKSVTNAAANEIIIQQIVQNINFILSRFATNAEDALINISKHAQNIKFQKNPNPAKNATRKMECITNGVRIIKNGKPVSNVMVKTECITKHALITIEPPQNIKSKLFVMNVAVKITYTTKNVRNINLVKSLCPAKNAAGEADI